MNTNSFARRRALLAAARGGAVLSAAMLAISVVGAFGASFAALAIDYDLSRDDESQLHDIFQKYDDQLSSTGQLDGTELELEVRNSFANIGYQELKDVICVFWKGGRWRDVCREYAAQKQCVEFHEILER